jgi:hypothetical protein
MSFGAQAHNLGHLNEFGKDCQYHQTMPLINEYLVLQSDNLN